MDDGAVCRSRASMDVVGHLTRERVFVLSDSLVVDSVGIFGSWTMLTSRARSCSFPLALCMLSSSYWARCGSMGSTSLK